MLKKRLQVKETFLVSADKSGSPWIRRTISINGVLRDTPAGRVAVFDSSVNPRDYNRFVTAVDAVADRLEGETLA